MVLSDRAEEILESLWVELIEQDKEFCDVSILKNDETLIELIDQDYVQVKDIQLSLTRKGKEEARGCIRRHRLAERLVSDILDIKNKLMQETSCKFEHLLHKGLDEHVCMLLGHPKICPHGKPIPEGNCCKSAKGTQKKLIMPLSDLELNKKAKISYLQTLDNIKLQKIIAMGALPNIEIALIQKFPSYVFKIGKSQFAIDEELAYCIYVRII
jgi:DtxR family Mn-dependent transcriptional regulator